MQFPLLSVALASYATVALVPTSSPVLDSSCAKTNNGATTAAENNGYGYIVYCSQTGTVARTGTALPAAGLPVVAARLCVVLLCSAVADCACMCVCTIWLWTSVYAWSLLSGVCMCVMCVGCVWRYGSVCDCYLCG